MKKIVTILSILALIVSSCGQATNKQTQSEQEKQQSEESINGTDTLSEVLKINDVSQLPKGITYEGEFKEGFQYSDKSGKHIAIITEKRVIHEDKYENEVESAELFAYNFAVNEDNSTKQQWRVYDFDKDCQLDVAADFINDTFQITDLNNNGIAEIWFAYILGCTGDISPLSMKVIMYEGKQKFAMRGTQKIILQGEIYGGGYQFDSAFNNGLKIFRNFAQKLWNEHGIIDYDKE